MMIKNLTVIPLHLIFSFHFLTLFFMFHLRFLLRFKIKVIYQCKKSFSNIISFKPTFSVTKTKL